MLQKFWKRMKREDGFTLLELLVVIAILGIIAAIATPRFLNVMDDARVNASKSTGKQVQVAMERLNFANAAYPAGPVAPATLTWAWLTTQLGNTLNADPHDGTLVPVNYAPDNANHTYTLVLTITNVPAGATGPRAIRIQPGSVVTGSWDTTNTVFTADN